MPSQGSIPDRYGLRAGCVFCVEEPAEHSESEDALHLGPGGAKRTATGRVCAALFQHSKVNCILNVFPGHGVHQRQRYPGM
jgi:hypothetical protein